MCARGIREGHLLADLRLVPGALHACDNRRVRGGELARQHVQVREADDRRVLPHDCARIQFERATIANDHDAAALGDQVEISHEIDVREHLDDQVDAAPAGLCHDVLLVTGSRMIEDLVRALLARKLPCRVRYRPCQIPAIRRRSPSATAATPTAPLAPWIRTVSPGTARPLSKSARHAVT